LAPMRWAGLSPLRGSGSAPERSRQPYIQPLPRLPDNAGPKRGAYQMSLSGRRPRPHPRPAPSGTAFTTSHRAPFQEITWSVSIVRGISNVIERTASQAASTSSAVAGWMSVTCGSYAKPTRSTTPSTRRTRASAPTGSVTVTEMPPSGSPQHLGSPRRTAMASDDITAPNRSRCSRRRSCTTVMCALIRAAVSGSHLARTTFTESASGAGRKAVSCRRDTRTDWPNSSRRRHLPPARRCLVV